MAVVSRRSGIGPAGSIDSFDSGYCFNGGAVYGAGAGVSSMSMSDPGDAPSSPRAGRIEGNGSTARRRGRRCLGRASRRSGGRGAWECFAYWPFRDSEKGTIVAPICSRRRVCVTVQGAIICKVRVLSAESVPSLRRKQYGGWSLTQRTEGRNMFSRLGSRPKENVPWFKPHQPPV